MHVFENIIAKAVWEAHHGAFRELDVEGVVVEGDGHLLEERHSETEHLVLGNYYYKACDDSIIPPQTSDRWAVYCIHS